MTDGAKKPEGGKNKSNKFDLIKKYKFPIIVGLICLSISVFAFNGTWFNNPLLKKPVETNPKKDKVDLVKQLNLEKKISELKEKIEVNNIATDYLNGKSNQLPNLQAKIEKITKYDWSLNQKQLIVVLLSLGFCIVRACVIEKGEIKKLKPIFLL